MLSNIHGIRLGQLPIDLAADFAKALSDGYDSDSDRALASDRELAGDSGQNLSMLSQSFRLPHVKWIFPTAPNRPVTLNGGAIMPGGLRDCQCCIKFACL